MPLWSFVLNGFICGCHIESLTWVFSHFLNSFHWSWSSKEDGTIVAYQFLYAAETDNDNCPMWSNTVFSLWLTLSLSFLNNAPSQPFPIMPSSVSDDFTLHLESKGWKEHIGLDVELYFILGTLRSWMFLSQQALGFLSLLIPSGIFPCVSQQFLN